MNVHIRFPGKVLRESAGSAGEFHAVGKVVWQEDASGWQTFKYGKLGELTENIRTFALPFESQTYTFKMEYEYDPFNRIQNILYPDSELVEYSYNLGGMLSKVTGSVTRKVTDLVGPMQMHGGSLLPGGNELMGGGAVSGDISGNDPFFIPTETIRYSYIDSIVYNKFELKDSVIYGNGTRVRYAYDSLYRLVRLRSYTAEDELMQDIAYHYDSVGNILDIENMAATLNNGSTGAYYQYDAGGDRTYKLLYHKTTGSLNGLQTDYYTLDDATLYVSPYLVVTPQGYTKHYYAESERITTQLGKYRFAVVDSCVAGDSLAPIKLQNAAQAFPTDSFPTPMPMLGYLHSLTDHPNTVSTLYFYHPDHLGSASWITNIYGRTIQHLYYLPWGEDLVNQRSSHFDGVRYTFSAKEKDTETGYSYFGARYYSSDLSIWLSVDPMSEERSWASPYSYCQNRPMRLIDPTGTLDWIPPTDGSGNWIAQKGDGYWKLSQQAGIPLEEAKNAVIAANRNRGQNRTSETMVYPGDVVHVNANNSRTQNNNNVSYYLPYPASGRCEPVSVFDVLMEEFVREPLQAMFERFGMKEESAYWLSTSAVIIPSFVVTKKFFIGKRSIKYPGNNPAKAPVGFEWRGKPGCPPGTKGNCYNPRTKESLHPDLDHPAPIGPHWDYIEPTGKKWRWFENGTMIEK